MFTGLAKGRRGAMDTEHFRQRLVTGEGASGQDANCAHATVCGKGSVTLWGPSIPRNGKEVGRVSTLCHGKKTVIGEATRGAILQWGEEAGAERTGQGGLGGSSLETLGVREGLSGVANPVSSPGSHRRPKGCSSPPSRARPTATAAPAPRGSLPRACRPRRQRGCGGAGRPAASPAGS